MPKIEIDGLTIHYQQMGEGPDIVLLHGLSGDLAFWHPTVMTGLAAGHRVTLLDFRGHGRSSTPPSGYTTRDMAGDVADLLIGLDLARAHVVGHSYGGAVALHLAALHPDRVTSLVLADARVRSLQQNAGVQEWQHWERIRSWLCQRGVEIRQWADPDFGLLEELARCRLAGKLEGISAGPFFIPFSAGSSRRAEKWLKLVSETTAVADFKDVAGLTPTVIQQVEQPTLAVYGTLSHCLHTQAALVKLMPDCRAVTIERAGHFHPLVAPQAFLDHTLAFIREVGARDAVPVPVFAPQATTVDRRMPSKADA